MTFRKRRNPTPGFNLPPPYQPMTGQRAQLQIPGLFPYVAQMQVAERDIYDKYVICRGFDTRINRFIDYEDGNADKPGIPVAKPWGFRMKGLYTKAEIHTVVLPTQGMPSTFHSPYQVAPSPDEVKTRLGQNPGKAKDSSDQPYSLDEELEQLTTDDDKPIHWMFANNPSSMIWGMLMEDHPGCYTCFKILKGQWCPSESRFMFDCTATEDEYLTAMDLHYTEICGGSLPEPAMYAQGWFMLMPLGGSVEGTSIAIVVSLDCDSRGECTPELTDGECPEASGDPCSEGS